mgnify:CR=1 FL=1
MKVLLYAEGLKVIGVSGLGKAIQHQMKALELEGIPYTTDINDTYDIAHINTYFLKSYFLARKLKKKGKKSIVKGKGQGANLPSCKFMQVQLFNRVKGYLVFLFNKIGLNEVIFSKNNFTPYFFNLSTISSILSCINGYTDISIMTSLFLINSNTSFFILFNKIPLLTILKSVYG